MRQPAGSEARSIQRSVLVLVLSLTVVLLLTAVIFENSPASSSPAAIETGQSANEREQARAGERYFLIGQEFWRQGEFVKAEEMLRLALLHQRRNPDTLRLLAMTVFAQARYDETELLFRQLTRLQPDQAGNYLNLAVTQLYLHRAADAGVAATAGLPLASQDQTGWLHFILACVEAQNGQAAPATEHLRLAHGLLGDRLAPFAAAEWAKSLQQLADYRQIMQVDPTRPVESAPPALPGAFTPGLE